MGKGKIKLPKFWNKATITSYSRHLEMLLNQYAEIDISTPVEKILKNDKSLKNSDKSLIRLTLAQYALCGYENWKKIESESDIKIIISKFQFRKNTVTPIFSRKNFSSTPVPPHSQVLST